MSSPEYNQDLFSEIQWPAVFSEDFTLQIPDNEFDFPSYSDILPPISAPSVSQHDESTSRLPSSPGTQPDLPHLEAERFASTSAALGPHASQSSRSRTFRSGPRRSAAPHSSRPSQSSSHAQAGEGALDTSSESSKTPEQSRQVSEFIDLTEDPSPNLDMASRPQGNKRRRLSREALSHTSSHPRVVDLVHKAPQSQVSNNQTIEEVDLRDVDDEDGLSKVLEEQRLATVKAQQAQAAIPLKFGALQCIICMDVMTDVTVTVCGHIFCNACLMEALIAGENQSQEAGRGTSRCPVCRRKIKRTPTGKRDTGQTTILEIKLRRNTQGRSRAKS